MIPAADTDVAVRVPSPWGIHSLGQQVQDNVINGGVKFCKRRSVSIKGEITFYGGQSGEREHKVRRIVLESDLPGWNRVLPFTS